VSRWRLSRTRIFHSDTHGRLGYGRREFGDDDLAVAGLEIGNEDLISAGVKGAAAPTPSHRRKGTIEPPPPPQRSAPPAPPHASNMSVFFTFPYDGDEGGEAREGR